MASPWAVVMADQKVDLWDFCSAVPTVVVKAAQRVETSDFD